MLTESIIFILFGIFSITVGGEYRYNTETFYISADDSRWVVRGQTSGYYVLNVGKPILRIEAWIGNAFEWTKMFSRHDLKHGESITIRYSSSVTYGGLRVINYHTFNGYVHAYDTYNGFKEFDELDTKYFKLDSNELLKTIVGTGAAYIPMVGEALSGVVDFFWPEEEENVWEEIEEQVKELVDSRIQETVEDILNGALDQFKQRIKNVYREIEDPLIKNTVGKHFENIAEDLIGFEKRFQFKGENSVNANFYLLPLYTATINLKLLFFQYGIKNWKDIGLDKELPHRLTYYIFESIHDSNFGAVKYIHKSCKEKLDHTYMHAYAETLFDELAAVHEYCALNGLEHLPRWKSIAANPNITSKPDVPVIVYTNQFGRNTAKQTAEMVIPTHPSLTPKLINGKINVPTKVTVFLTGDNKIGGLKITSADGNVAKTGPRTKGNKKKEIDFQGTRLTQLIARGSGQINGLQFVFENNRTVDAGTLRGNIRTFTLEKHHIIGFYMTNSLVRISRDLAANIAVSYQLIVD